VLYYEATVDLCERFRVSVGTSIILGASPSEHIVHIIYSVSLMPKVATVGEAARSADIWSAFAPSLLQLLPTSLTSIMVWSRPWYFRVVWCDDVATMVVVANLKSERCPCPTNSIQYHAVVSSHRLVVHLHLHGSKSVTLLCSCCYRYV